MIDLLLPILVVLWGFVRAVRRFGARPVLIASCGMFLAAHLLFVIALSSRDLSYDHVVHPSQASAAGISGRGRIEGEEGLLSFLGRALSEEKLTITSQGKEFTRELPVAGRWMFWRAVDSYLIEEASGGFAFFPRRPIFHGQGDAFAAQIRKKGYEGVRIVSTHGIETPTIGSFLEILAQVPRGGTVLVKSMQPGPDNSAVSVILSPSVFATSSVEEAQPYLGFSSLPFAVNRPGGEEFYPVVYAVNSKPVYGPLSFRERVRQLRNIPGKVLNAHHARTPIGGRYFHATLLPRLALTPWLHESGVVTFLVGVPGTFLRQVFSLTNLPGVIGDWHLLPKQLYALADGVTLPFVFFKGSGLAASCALALLFWMALACWPKTENFCRKRRVRGIFLFALALAFQLGDLFVFHRFLL